MTTVGEGVGVIPGLFLRRAVFLGVALKLMESQGGAKEFGITGILTPACLCATAQQKCFLQREALNIRCLFATVKFIPVNDGCP